MAGSAAQEPSRPPGHEDNLGHDPRHDESATRGPANVRPGSKSVSVAPARHAPFAQQHTQIQQASPFRSGGPIGFAVLAQRT